MSFSFISESAVTTLKIQKINFRKIFTIIKTAMQALIGCKQKEIVCLVQFISKYVTLSKTYLHAPFSTTFLNYSYRNLLNLKLRADK